MRVVAFALAALLAPVLWSSLLAADEPVRLAPHRAVYDLSLAKSTGSRSVENASGRIAFDFTGDSCAGYALKYRQVTVMESAETGARTSDLRTATFEEGDGKAFQFRTDSDSGSKKETVEGQAERQGDTGIAVRLKQPKRDSYGFNGDIVFPTAHMRRLVEAARAGQTTLTIKVFDGSEDGRKVYDTLAVIGRRIEPGNVGALEAAAHQEGLARLARWPVTLSYFTAGEGERTPVYVLSFDMYENGVSRALLLDYGDFALKGDMQKLDLLPEAACQR
jgi:EipB-like